MSLVLEHLEYLIRRHDFVAVPGLGALMVRYRPASFRGGNSLVLLPPSRELAFNGALTASDGVLENSVARRCGVSFEVARKMVKEDAESLICQLHQFGTLALGHLGRLSQTEHDTIVFTPSPVADWDCRFYGLCPLELQEAEVLSDRNGAVSKSAVQEKPVLIQNGGIPGIEPWNVPDENATTTPRRNKIARSIVGIAASLAVIVTLALLVLNPIRVANEPLKASIAPSTSLVNAPENKDTDEDLLETLGAESNMAEQEEMTGSQPLSSVDATTLVDNNPTIAPTTQTTSEESPGLRFNESDPFCVIVASFPDASQADRYIAENRGRDLGVLQQDGKFRVYAATGGSYEEATTQKSLTGTEGAWICRR